MEIRIRPGTRADHDLIWRATLETVWSDIPADERRLLERPAFEEHFRPRAQRVLASKDNAIFVAERVDGGVVGYAIVGKTTSMLGPEPFGFVYDLWVAPEARRQGVARRLVAHASDWCRAQGCRRLKLEVAATNAAARAFYAANGFVEERLFLGKSL